MIKLDINDAAVVGVLKNWQNAVGKVSPILKAVGEDMVSRIKRRFDTSTDPDGNRWAANSSLTLRRFEGAQKVYQKGKNQGRYTQAAAWRIANKRPLIGESGDLRRQTAYGVSGNGNVLVIGNLMKYAAVQQFGAEQGAFGRSKRNGPLPWGNIPARPFFPISASGELSPFERLAIVQKITTALRQKLDGRSKA